MEWDWAWQWWIVLGFTAIVGVLTTWVKRLHSQLKKVKSEENAIRKGMRSLLRDRLIQSHNYFVYTKKICSVYERDRISDMYESYTALNGNGIVPGLIEDIMELPTENKEEGAI